jgi:hypothetical protein
LVPVWCPSVRPWERTAFADTMPPIGLILVHEPKIRRYEERHPVRGRVVATAGGLAEPHRPENAGGRRNGRRLVHCHLPAKG